MAPADEPTEDDATPEERLAWLRARGVTVEEPASRRSAPTVNIGGPKFTYVRIPLDDADICEELTAPITEGDSLPSLLAPVYAVGADKVSDDVLAAHAAKSGQTVAPALLRQVMAAGGAETFRLAVPTEDNGGQEVTAYLDEASALKGLPTNERATALARACGFPDSCVLCGDIYLSRRQWSKSGQVKNVDFGLEDLNPASEWMRRAGTDNLREQAATRPEEHAAAQAGGDKPAGGEGEGYSWRDQGDEIEIVIAVAKGTGKKDVKLDFKRQELRLAKPVEMTLKLFKAIEVDGCNWTLGDAQLIVTVEKADNRPWPQLLA
eukprot:TRINITY_DN111952_c0_g1_i1.p1 TRINITY_DN111952_c0_g1~~TRINITY_DN111952_c0_g1_i1.p1  ORF type:complete len:344 (-),score=77.85 TRINITY_DN111952_c0_g1_i1:157-1119(-)